MAQDLMNNGMPLKHILVRWNQKIKVDTHDITFHPSLSLTSQKCMRSKHFLMNKKRLKCQLIIVHTHLPQEEQSQCDYDVSEPFGVGMSNCGYKDSSLTTMTAHSHMGKGASMAPL